MRKSDINALPTSYRLSGVVLPRVVVGVEFATAEEAPLPLQPGDRVDCPECGGVHTVVPCSSPDQPLTYVVCEGQLVLASVKQFNFFNRVDPDKETACKS